MKRKNLPARLGLSRLAGRQKLRTSLKNYWIKVRRKAAPYSSTIRLVIFFILGAIIFGLTYLIFPWIARLANRVFVGPRMAISLLTADTSSLASYNNRTNLLILGIGGGNHETIDLTDTIIFASIDRGSGDTVMLSIPRDLWIEPLQTKINEI